MHRRSVLIAGLGIAAAGSAFAAKPKPAKSKPAPQDAQAIVTAIYKATAGKNGKYQGVSPFDTKVVRDHFTASLLDALVKMEAKSKRLNEPILDFNPILNTQEEPDVKNLTIATESAGPENSVIAAQFFSYDEKFPTIIRYEFVLEKDAWKIDNMRGEHGTDDNWSLRDIISK